MKNRLHPLAWLLMLLALFALGCADESAAWVEFVAERSATASAEGEGADDEDAERALLDIVERDVPGSVAAEDARVVLQDARDRLAQVAVSRGDLQTAQRHVDAGLALGVREDLFTANLLTTRGRLHEARGDDRQAAADYHLALRISEALLDRVLSGD